MKFTLDTDKLVEKALLLGAKAELHAIKFYDDKKDTIYSHIQDSAEKGADALSDLAKLIKEKRK